MLWWLSNPLAALWGRGIFILYMLSENLSLLYLISSNSDGFPLGRINWLTPTRYFSWKDLKNLRYSLNKSQGPDKTLFYGNCWFLFSPSFLLLLTLLIQICFYLLTIFLWYNSFPYLSDLLIIASYIRNHHMMDVCVVSHCLLLQSILQKILHIFVQTCVCLCDIKF